jgi:site-specific recombinase XerD
MKVKGKGGGERVVPIGRSALRCLETYLLAIRSVLVRDGSGEAVFIGRYGDRIGGSRVQKLVRKYAQAADLPVNVTPHTFRRTCITEMVRGGANLYHVKELLGHASFRTLNHYAKLNINDLKKTHAQCHPRERKAED